MRRGNSVVLIVAVLMGLGAAFLARNWIEKQAAAVPDRNTATIVVAAVPLKFGAELSRDNTSEIPWPADKIPRGAFRTQKDLLKKGARTVLTPLERDEPVLAGKITGPGQRASLSSLLKSGRTAVTVAVDDIRGVAGFVLPGDRVDVVLIRSQGGDKYADVLLQSVKVLAIDQTANERSDKAKVARAVTLDVTTEQAQKVLLAATVGRLSLILRKAGQAHQQRVKRVTEADLVPHQSGPEFIHLPAHQAPKAKQAQQQEPDSTAIVDIVRGTKRSKYKVDRAVEPQNTMPSLVR